jgi:hypothetical protein
MEDVGPGAGEDDVGPGHLIALLRFFTRHLDIVNHNRRQ